MTVILTLIDDNDSEEKHGALERVEQHPDRVWPIRERSLDTTRAIRLTKEVCR